MWKKSRDEKFSRLMMDIFPRNTPHRGATPNAQLRKSRAGAQRPTFNAPRSRCAHPLGHPVTQLAYARQGIITPEMEFIAIRENLADAHRDSRAAIGNSPNSSHSTPAIR